jgi:hypothetical protein
MEEQGSATEHHNNHQTDPEQLSRRADAQSHPQADDRACEPGIPR